MLKRLRIKGFKSFADPVDLEFGPGINVIVGPNGSGKSNISEAIAWALGEQRAGRLRAPAMQDILFSGGDGRQAVGMAEVSMTLDGEVAQGDPAELGVTRRLTRAGDSGYKLNNGNCRLVDVLDALSSRGLGPQSLSIIRQGQVDQICQSKPAALRAILDEAAGTGLPKRRRHRAELRLKHVDEHLSRARDLAGEIASRARSLERQARAAERAGPRGPCHRPQAGGRPGTAPGASGAQCPGRRGERREPRARVGAPGGAAGHRRTPGGHHRP